MAYAPSPQMEQFLDELRSSVASYKLFEQSLEPWTEFETEHREKLLGFYAKLTQKEQTEIAKVLQPALEHRKDTRNQLDLYKRLLARYEDTIRDEHYDGRYTAGFPPIWEQYNHMVVVHEKLSADERKLHPLPTGAAKDPRPQLELFSKHARRYTKWASDADSDGYWDEDKMRLLWKQMIWAHSNLTPEERVCHPMPAGDGEDHNKQFHAYVKDVAKYNSAYAAVARDGCKWHDDMPARYKALRECYEALSEEDQKRAPLPSGNGTDPTPAPTPLSMYREKARQYKGTVNHIVSNGYPWGNTREHYERLVTLHNALTEEEKQANPLPDDEGKDPRTPLQRFLRLDEKCNRVAHETLNSCRGLGSCTKEKYADMLREAYDALSEEDKETLEVEKIVVRNKKPQPASALVEKPSPEDVARVQRINHLSKEFVQRENQRTCDVTRVGEIYIL